MNDKTKIIGIFYIIFGALGILGLPLIFVNELMMDSIFASMGDVGPEAQEMVDLYRELMAVLIPALIALTIVHIVFNVLVGIFFIKHKAYRTCFATSILTSLVFPMGTVLGVFALIVLSNEETKKLFYQNKV